MTRVLASARPPFLILGPLVVGLAVAATIARGSAVDWTAMALILLASVAGHVSANAFNEYFDHRSGLDSSTRRTPFSGGSGLLPASPQLAPAVLTLAWASLLLSLAIGAWLAWTREPALIVLGALGVLLVYGYTRWMHRWPLACYLAPGLGFGAVVYLASSWVVNPAPGPLDAGLACVVGLLASNLLLLNQFPDVDADRQVGRRHFPIVIGRPASARLHAIGAVLVFALILAMIPGLELPVWTALGLVPALLLIPLLSITLRHPDDVDRLLPALAMNVVLTLSVPLLLAIGLLLGA